MVHCFDSADLWLDLWLLRYVCAVLWCGLLVRLRGVRWFTGVGGCWGVLVRLLCWVLAVVQISAGCVCLRLRFGVLVFIVVA